MNFEQKKNIGFRYVLDKLSPKSGFGAKALRYISPYSNKEKLCEELQNLVIFIDKIMRDKNAFDAINGFLSHIKDIDGTFDRIGQDISEVELFELKSYCSLCACIANEITTLFPTLYGIEIISLDKPFEILNLSKTSGFFLSDEHSQKLADIRKEKRFYAQKLSTSQGEEREKYRLLHLELSANEEEEEIRLRRDLSNQLIPFAKAMKHNARCIARIDLLVQKAVLCMDENGIVPTIGSCFELEEAFNPYIANILKDKGKQFCGITLSLEGVTVITGANMGGKTIALKTVALNAYCALCGFPVFAKHATLPFLDFVEILSEDLQSSERGLSSFGGEVIKINELFSKAQKSKGLLLIDEFASGTNYEEGAKIFSALLRALKNTPSLSLLTTHFDGVCKDATCRYQIIGLSDEAKRILKNQSVFSKKNIAEYMNYGLIKTDKLSEIPKDAIDICLILGMSEEIMSLI